MGCHSSKMAVSPPASAAATLLASNSNAESKQPHHEEHGKARSGDQSTAGSPSAGAASSTSHSHAALRRQESVMVNREHVDFLVTKFTCHDSTVLASLGKHSKEAAWTVQASQDSSPMEVKVHVDKSVLSNSEVRVTCDGNPLFPPDKSITKARLLEDFRFQWPFRGTIREGLNEPGRFEIRACGSSNEDQWFTGTLTKQRGDGSFEALVKVPDCHGFMRELQYPAVKKERIRDAVTKQPIQVQEQSLVLEVPCQDPLQAALNVDGNQLATHYFGRPTPKCPQEKDVVTVVQSDDRKSVSANVGHSSLSHFLSGEVRRVSSDMKHHCKTWTVQIGPFAEHTIKVECQPWPSKIVVLTVDDEVLVEASAEDIGCDADVWECNFRFAGEKVIDFDVYENNVDGAKLETRGHAFSRERYSHACSVRYVSLSHGCDSELTIDDVQFVDLQPKTTMYEEKHLSLDLKTLKDNYGIELPQKINWTAPVGLVGGLRALVAKGGAVDTTEGAAGLAVVKKAAADAALAGAVAAASAAASGAAAVSAAAVEAQPHVSKAVERAADEMNMFFAQCCKPNSVQADDVSLAEVDSIKVMTE